MIEKIKLSLDERALDIQEKQVQADKSKPKPKK